MNKITKIIIVSVMLSLSSCTVNQISCYRPSQSTRQMQTAKKQKTNDRARRAITWATVGIMIGFVVTH